MNHPVRSHQYDCNSYKYSPFVCVLVFINYFYYLPLLTKYLYYISYRVCTNYKL
jgi:hypothetical protein